MRIKQLNSFIHYTDVKPAIPLSTNQTSDDRKSPEERLNARAGLATPTGVQVEKKPEASSRFERQEH